jgi:hypothetical protein
MQSSAKFNILEKMARGTLPCPAVPERDERHFEIAPDGDQEAFK